VGTLVLATILGAGLLVVAIVTRPDPPVTLVTVQAAVGSENLAFFQDPEVRAEFARNGFDVAATGFGSNDLANIDLSRYDLVFPSSTVLAQEFLAKQQYQLAQVVPYSTPIAVATWTSIAPLLRRIGVATERGGIWYFNIIAYLQIVRQGKVWTQIDQNTTYRNPNQIVLTTTDPLSSNSAEMFVAAASDALNKGIVKDIGPIPEIADAIAPAFLAQGVMKETTDQIFNDYLTNGPNTVPMALIYESEFLGSQLAGGPARLPAGALLMYPDTLVDADHTVLARDSHGTTIANLLKTDPRLEYLEANSYGFHNTLGSFQRDMKSHGIDVPAEFPSPVPTRTVLGELINAIEDRIS
jgi:hypothetical protein